MNDWAILNGLNVDHIVSIIGDVAGDSLERLGAVAEALGQNGRATVWGLVEVCGRVEAKYGPVALREFMRLHDLPSHSVYRWRKIYKAFPKLEDRNPLLGPTVHYMAALTDDPKGWLKKAGDNNLTQRKLREQIRGTPTLSVNFSNALVDSMYDYTVRVGGKVVARGEVDGYDWADVLHRMVQAILNPNREGMR